jgi:hypothetical protein
MGKRARRIAFTGIMTGLAVAGTEPAVSAAHEEHALLRVALVNHAGVPEDIWQRAQTTASRIYEVAGIQVLWIDSAATTVISTPQSDVTVIVSAAPSAPGLTSSKHVLGFALQPRNRGRLAYAFYGRIQDFARDTRTDAGSMLGHVMAHEIGHLLLSREAHSLFGLMRGRWHESQAELVSAGLLTFTNDEATVIRAHVARRSADILARHPK